MNAKGFSLSLALIALTVAAVMSIALLQWSGLNRVLAQAPDLQRQQLQRVAEFINQGGVGNANAPRIACPELYASWHNDLVLCQRDMTTSNSAGRIVYRQQLTTLQVAEVWP